MPAVEFAEWKTQFLEEIEQATDTIQKGDIFVQKILRNHYQLSEEDAIDATFSAGSGDYGIDAIYIEESTDDQEPRGL